MRLPAAARGTVVLAVLATVLLGVAGCESKVGAAAVVGGSKISESDVGHLVATSAAKPTDARSTALEWLIRQELFSTALKRNGGVPSSSELATYHDAAFGSVLGAQVTGSEADSQLQKAVANAGLNSQFASTLLNAAELELALAKKIGVNSSAGISAEINRQQIKVSVSPRFGGWNNAQLALTQPGKSQLPPGVSLSTTLPGDQVQSAQPGQ